MDLHHLKYFLVAVEEGSFQRASERLGVAPSALSRRIQDLEGELGIALIERVSSGIRPSYAGRIFVDYARRILAEIDETADHFRRLAKGQTGILRVAINGIAPQLPFVPALFRAFRTASPEIELKLVSMTSEDQLVALRERAIDAGFLYTLPDDESEFAHLRLASHRFVVAMTADHRLATQDAIVLADLADEDFILFTRESGRVVYDRIMAHCRARGLEPRIVQETVGEHTQLGLVAAGMGVSFVNETVTMRQSRPDLVFKPVVDLDVAEHLDLTWLRGESLPVLDRFVALARAA